MVCAVGVNQSNYILGRWCLNHSGSHVPPLVMPRTAEIETDDSYTRIKLSWADSGNNVVSNWSVTLAKSGDATSNSIQSRVWAYNVYVAVEYNITGSRTAAILESTDSQLLVSINDTLLTSQGDQFVSTKHRWSNDKSSHALLYAVNYSLGDQPTSFNFYYTSCPSTDRNANPAGLHPRNRDYLHNDEIAPAVAADPQLSSSSAFWLNLTDSWHLNATEFHWNAVAVALQGLANRQRPTLYLQYPPTWDYTYTASVREYLTSDRNITLTKLPSVEQALKELMHDVGVRGYVKWDPEVRQSLVVAYTACGVLNAIPIPPSLTPVVESLGLKMLLDLRERFKGQSPVQIYSWAQDQFSESTNKTMVVWAGGECAPIMQPGIMDYGVAHRSFFTDLSTKTSSVDYSLADAIVGRLTAIEATGMPPLVMGWHSYCTDEEHTFTTLASKHGARVHGLNTNPNLSFLSRIPVSDQFSFRNNLSPPLTPSRMKELEGKVVVALVQTDGLGLGAWAQPGRGKIPYAWEVMLPDLELQPALLEMFYKQATAKDLFVAALSGPGYMYPRAVPADILPKRLHQAQSAMKLLDLHHMVVFDASHTFGAHTVTGDTTLTSDIVSAYFQHMNSTRGFLNGYAPTFTNIYDNKTRRGMISYDYYLDPGRDVASASSDLIRLARINPQRPYLLAIHVREFSTIGKVEQILELLPADTFSILPVDQWFQVANDRPTYYQKYK